MTLWRVKFFIESLLKFENETIISGIVFYTKDKKNYADVVLEAPNIDKANKKAELILSDVLSTIKFTLNQRISYQIHETRQEVADADGGKQVASFFPCSITIVRTFPTEELENINKLNTELNLSNSVGVTAYQSFLRGIEVGEWYNEAFLNFFKAIEVIANTYLEEGKKEKAVESKPELDVLICRLKKCIEHDELNQDLAMRLCSQIHKLGFVEFKKRLHIALFDLELTEYAKDAEEIVDFRNQYVAHGSSRKIVEKMVLNKCREIAKMMITKYLNKNRS